MMISNQVLIVICLSIIIGIVFGYIKGFEWWFPSTLISMNLIGLIWLWKDKDKQNLQGEKI